MSIASYQFVLVYVVDDRMFDGHDHDDDDDELGFDPDLASSSTIKIESLFKSKRKRKSKNRKSFILLVFRGISLHSFFFVIVPDSILFFSAKFD